MDSRSSPITLNPTRFGVLYASDNQLKRDALVVRRPGSILGSPLFFDLAQAEEANYRFVAGARSYTQAFALEQPGLLHPLPLTSNARSPRPPVIDELTNLARRFGGLLSLFYRAWD